MNKLNDILPTLQGGAGFTLLQVMPEHLDYTKAASALVVLITALVQFITLFKKKKLEQL